MPIDIHGVRYLSSTEVAERARVSRQTVWRWRKRKTIPAGRRFRNGQVLFTETETAEIEDYANKMESLEDGLQGQPTLF